MRFALAQINPTSGDIKRNSKMIARTIEDSARKNIDVVVFPEMALPGYCIADLVENKKFLEANKNALENLAVDSKGIASVIGFIDFNENNPVREKYNAAAVLKDGEILGIARKSKLPSYRYFDDKRYFCNGKERAPIKVETDNGEVNIGLCICEDMWENGYNINPVDELAEKGAEIILSLNASPFSPGKSKQRMGQIESHVKKTGLPFAYVNTVGAADNGKNIIPFDGQSMVYDSRGNLAALGKQFGEDVLLFDFCPETNNVINQNPAIPEQNREREIYEALVMGIKDYARKTGFKKIIEPVSGGIDSCLGLAICTEALGHENIIAFNLPTDFNTDETRFIAKKLAENFGVDYKIIPIQEIYEKSAETFEANAHRISKNISMENLQSRIRGLMMMLESNDSNALLVSNGNKTEIALGYATLYGDMCGGISVIGDLSKSDVYKTARYVNERHGKAVIPTRAFELKPSAELCHGQVDPFDYIAVSPIVDEFVEKRSDPSELKELFKNHGLDMKKFEKYPDGKNIYEKYDYESFGNLVDDTYEKFRKSVFKRIQAPPIIAVTDRAFGYDLRETLINEWEG
jgi:NAD+ synthase (glutamine-hydrolysing)